MGPALSGEGDGEMGFLYFSASALRVSSSPFISSHLAVPLDVLLSCVAGAWFT